MRRRARRAMAFALVPLSALPIVFAAPLIAPSFEQRVDELFADTAQPASTETRTHPIHVTTPERRR